MRIQLSEQEKLKVHKMDVEPLAKFIFCYLKETLGPHPDQPEFYSTVFSLRNNLFPEANDYQIFVNDLKLLEAISSLQKRGLVVKALPYTRFSKHSEDFFVCLTSVGRESSVDDGVLLLVDEPEEIVRSLEEKIGALDDIVRQYYLESLRAFQEELCTSSVICLGAASERAIYWLAESIESWSGKYLEEFKTERKNPISVFTDYLHDKVIREISAFDRRFQNELKNQLNGLGALYRKNRNEAGHPQTIDQIWSREDQQVLLVGFRGYIATICKARKTLQ